MERSTRLRETVQDDKFVIRGGYRGRRSGRGNRNLSAPRRSNQCPKVPVQTASSSTTGNGSERKGEADGDAFECDPRGGGRRDDGPVRELRRPDRLRGPHREEMTVGALGG